MWNWFFCGAIITRSIEILHSMMLLSLWHWKYRGWRSGSSYRIHQVTHWGRVTHTCVSKLTITDSDNGLSPGRRQAIIWTNAEILLIGTPGTNFNRNSYIFIQENPFQNIVWKMAAVLSRTQCVKYNRNKCFVVGCRNYTSVGGARSYQTTNPTK